ncbi:DUF7507 domain-containing protein [Microbacterium paraoxydans]|uniref:DUF7507 domain-containing protein n=1 Tax=Microbacterium paraoxydans TaxID=199592 RepID=UPI001CFB00FF|nr:DUF11 domain-containing protein [Microbacterium paraoxydans]
MAHDSAHRPHTLSESRSRSRRRTIGGLAATAIAVGAVVIPGAMIDAPAAHAAEVFACSTIYAMNENNGAGSTLWSIDTATGSQTVIGTIDPGADPTSIFNGLGVAITPEHPEGAAYAMRADPWTTNDAGALATFDFATAATTTVDATRLPYYFGTRQTHGAVDPKTSLYFHGALNGDRLNLDGRDAVTGERRGRIAINFYWEPAPGGNGDIAFDRDGNLYIVMSSATEAGIYVVDARDIVLGTTSPYPTARPRLIQTFSVDDSGGLGVNGIAFDSEGYLVVSTGLELFRINPMSGEVTSQVTFTEPGVVDIASCSYPSHLTLEKDFPVGRDSDDATDQVQLTLSGAGFDDLSVTTLGTEIGVQHRRIVAPVLPGSVIRIEEAGTGADPARYQSSWACLDDATGDVFAAGAGTSGDVTVPHTDPAGVGVVCTFTNTPRSESMIALTKTANVSSAVLGDEVEYFFEITNTGRVPLHDITVDELAFDGAGTLSGVSCPASPLSLDAGESATCTATYSMQQEDVDRGSVQNTATATGTTPTDDRVVSPPSTALVTSPQSPALAIVKSAIVTSTDAESFEDGSIIDYQFLVTNTGDVTLTDVRVDDVAFTGSGSLSAVVCPAESAAFTPGQSMTCTATYAVDEADLALDTIDNTALATGTAPDGGPIESTPSTATTPRAVVIAPEVIDPGVATQAPDAEEAEAPEATGDLAATGLDAVGTLIAGAVALALLTLGTVLLVRRAARRHQA